MRNFIDKNGLYHEAPVASDGLPSSDNGFIYTAYAHLFKLPIDFKKVGEEVDRCLNEDHLIYKNFSMRRSGEGRSFVPISKDEIIGLAALGLLDYPTLQASNFVYYNPKQVPTKLTLIRFLKAAKTLWKIRKEHRTEVWKGGHYDAFILAFGLVPSDRYFVKKMHGKKTTLLEAFHWHTNLAFSALRGKFYSKTIAYLEGSLLKTKNPFFRLLNRKKIFAVEFPADHPIRIAAER